MYSYNLLLHQNLLLTVTWWQYWVSKCFRTWYIREIQSSQICCPVGHLSTKLPSRTSTLLIDSKGSLCIIIRTNWQIVDWFKPMLCKVSSCAVEGVVDLGHCSQTVLSACCSVWGHWQLSHQLCSRCRFTPDVSELGFCHYSRVHVLPTHLSHSFMCGKHIQSNAALPRRAWSLEVWK